jgi:hypothetical protein
MKKRGGFVSNSSSASYVVLLPKNITIARFDLNKANPEYYGFSNRNEYADAMVNSFHDLITSDMLMDDDCQSLDALKDLLERYVIATLSTGPGEGQIVIADIETTKNILINQRL